MHRILLACGLLVLPAVASAQIRIDATIINSGQFQALTPEQLEAAVSLRVLFRTASVGQNIAYGLNCLAYNGPYACRTGFSTPAQQIAVVSRPQYAHPNWSFEHRGNPGWDNKVRDFVQQATSRHTLFDVLTWKQSYVDDARIARFWDRSLSPGIAQIEAVEAIAEQSTVVYMTAALSRQPQLHIASFNDQMRAYATSTGKPLFDLASLESDGGRCRVGGIETICPEYCIEPNGGHLTNGASRQRVAQAFWVLMARLAQEVHVQ